MCEMTRGVSESELHMMSRDTLLTECADRDRFSPTSGSWVAPDRRTETAANYLARLLMFLLPV